MSKARLVDTRKAFAAGVQIRIEISWERLRCSQKGWRGKGRQSCEVVSVLKKVERAMVAHVKASLQAFLKQGRTHWAVFCSMHDWISHSGRLVAS